MSFCCGIVAYNETILASHYIDRKLELSKMIKHILVNKLIHTTQSFQNQSDYYHCLMTPNGYRYVVVTTNPRLTEPYKCLYSMADAFSTLNISLPLEENSLDSVFSHQIENLLALNDESDRYEDLKEIIVHNLVLTTDRGRAIDELDVRARNLQNETSSLIVNTKVDTLNWDRNKLRLYMILIIVSILIGAIVVIVIVRQY
jgi:hypothetical protein